MNAGDYDYDKRYAERQLSRSRDPLRKFIKKFYLRNILQYVDGSTIDFGCGAGQLLEKLPPGSVGLEVNPYLVSTLQERGLDVKSYDPAEDKLSFSMFDSSQFNTFVMAHVLEHFENSAEGLRQILSACAKLRIHRVIIVVPGKKGYEIDKTHKTFVSKAYLEENRLLEFNGYSATVLKYFPGNWEALGRYFTFHEFIIAFDRAH